MSFRFLLDENMPRRLGRRLRDAGYDVEEALDDPLRGADDDVLWARAALTGRIFVTRDIGAATLQIRPAPPAVVLLRGPSRMSAAAIDTLFAEFWRAADTQQIVGHLASVRPGRFRFFPLR